MAADRDAILTRLRTRGRHTTPRPSGASGFDTRAGRRWQSVDDYAHLDGRAPPGRANRNGFPGTADHPGVPCGFSRHDVHGLVAEVLTRELLPPGARNTRSRDTASVLVLRSRWRAARTRLTVYGARPGKDEPEWRRFLRAGTNPFRLVPPMNPGHAGMSRVLLRPSTILGRAVICHLPDFSSALQPPPPPQKEKKNKEKPPPGGPPQKKKKKKIRTKRHDTCLAASSRILSPSSNRIRLVETRGFCDHRRLDHHPQSVSLVSAADSPGARR